MNRTDVALFPIPDCIAFPGAVYPLHVFEPRYRDMVRYCIDHDMPLGICHTRKLVHEAPEAASLEEALGSNRDTYQPQRVFSSGYCELREVLEDGRMLILVHVDQRRRIVDEVQTLPFRICRCESYDDSEPGAAERQAAAVLRDKVLTRLLALTAHSQEAQEMLLSNEWQQKDPLRFSLEIFTTMQLEPGDQQAILEMRSPVARLERLLAILNAH